MKQPLSNISEFLRALRDPNDRRVLCHCGSIDHLCRRECDEHVQQMQTRDEAPST